MNVNALKWYFIFILLCLIFSQFLILFIYVTPTFPAMPLKKSRSCQAPSWKFGRCPNPTSRKGGPHYGALRHWDTRLVSSGVSLTSWGEGASLSLVGHPSNDGITIKIPYGVDVLLHWPASHPIFSYWVS